MAKLDRWMLSHSRVIARGRRIREVDRLVHRYGGRASGWTKKSSPRFVIGGREFEYPWYEHAGVGRVELKRKEIDWS